MLSLIFNRYALFNEGHNLIHELVHIAFHKRVCSQPSVVNHFYFIIFLGRSLDAYALRREHGCLEPLGRDDVSFFAGTRTVAGDF